MNDPLIGAAGFGFGEKLCGADPIDGGWPDKRGIESFKIERAVDVDACAPCGGFHYWVRPLLDPAAGWFGLVFGVHCISKIDGFIFAQNVQQAVVKSDEFFWLFRRDTVCGRAVGLRYANPNRARSLIQPECEYSNPNSEAR